MIVFLIIFLVSTALTIVLFVDHEKNAGYVILAPIISFALLSAFAFQKETTRYEIYVSDDSIPYNKFTEHWKVISNDGMIITAERIDAFPVCDVCNQEYENDFTMFCPSCGNPIRYEEEEK